MPRSAARLLLLLLLIGAAGGAVLGLWTSHTATAAEIRSGVLAPPTQVSYSAGSLKWTPTVTAWASGTRVYRSSSSVGPYALVGELVGLDAAEYDDEVDGTTYYVVRSYYDGDGAEWTSAASAPVVATVDARLQLSRTQARPGTTLEGFLGGFPRGDVLRFRYDSPTGPELVGSVGGAAVPATLTIAGDQAVTVTLPGNATGGPHTVWVVGSPSGKQASAQVTVDVTPPVPPTFTSTPPPTAGGSSVVYEFTHPEPDVTFTCSRDGSPWAACTSPRTLNNLADGSHTFAVRAVSPQGLTSDAATHAYTLDNTPPAEPVITSSPFPVESSTGATFAFASGESGVTFRCSLNGSVPEPCTSPTSYTVANGEHVFTVRAVDAVGNASEPATFQWLVDTAGFRVYNTTPANGTALGPTAYTRGCDTPTTGDFCGNAMDGPDRLVTRVLVSIRKGKAQGAFWTGSNWNGSTEIWHQATLSADRRSWNWPLDVGRFTNDLYIVRVKAVDGAGLDSIVSETEFTYDNQAPTVVFTAPAATVYGAEKWRATCGTATVDDLCGTSGDTNSGRISRVGVSLRQGSTLKFWNGFGFGGDTELILTAAGTNSWTLPFEFTDFPADGAYTARVLSYDTAGNVSASTSVTFTIDATRPTGTVTFPVHGATYGPSSYSAGCGTTAADVCGTASDANGISAVRVSVRRGSGNWWNGSSFGSSTEQLLTATGTTNWSYALPTPTLSGSYTIRVYPVDGGGSTGLAATTTYSMDVTPPPPPTITSAPPTVTNSGTASFSFSTTEAGATYTCSLDGGTAASCTSPRSYTGLAAGTRTFVVRALDGYGNASSATYSWTIDTTAPSVAVSAPAASSVHSVATWRAMCGTAEVAEVCGTASDTGGAQVAEVRLSLQQGTGSYWNGTAFAGTAQVQHVATGTTGWTWDFAGASFPASGNYTLRAVAVDTAGNITGTPLTRTFAIDISAPSITSWTFPGSGVGYSSLNWNNGCSTGAPRGDFCGTAGDTGGGSVSKVEVSVRRDATGLYWDGLFFSSPSEVMLETTGTTSWNRLLPAAALDPGGAYTLRAVATDSVGNTSAPVSRTFSTAPVIRYVRSLGSAGQCSGSGTTLSFTVPADGIPVGRKLIARAVLRSSKTEGTVSMGTGWTLDADVNRDGLVRTLVFSRYVSTAIAGGTALTLTYPTAQSVALDISEYVGIASTQNDGRGYDEVVTGSGSGSVSQSYKVRTNDSLVVTSLGIAHNVAFTEASSWTTSNARSLNCASGRLDARGAYFLGAASGESNTSYNPTFPSANWALIIVAYRP